MKIKKRPFKEARELVSKKKFKSNKEYRKWVQSGKAPKGLPKHPDHEKQWKEDWTNWPDFLGKEFASYEIAKKYAHTLNLSLEVDWGKYVKKNILPEINNKKIPIQPKSYYSKQGKWENWSEFLGSKKTAKNIPKTVTYKECQKYALDNGIDTLKEWNRHYELGKLPQKFPKSLEQYFKKTNQWKGTEHFFQKETTHAYSYEKALPIAQKFCREKGITTKNGWIKYAQNNPIPKGLPKEPRSTYGEKEVKFRYFIWCGIDKDDPIRRQSKRDGEFASYEEHQKFAEKNNITTGGQWRRFVKYNAEKISPDISLAPDSYFGRLGMWPKNGWYDFLKQEKNPWCTYEDAKKYLKPFNFVSRRDYKKFLNQNKILKINGKLLPNAPEKVYGRQGVWIDWFDFLGNKDVRNTLLNLQNFVKGLLDSGLIDGTKSAGFNYYLMMRNKNINLNSTVNRKIIRTVCEMAETATGRKTLKEVSEGNFKTWIGKIEEELENRDFDPEIKENVTIDSKQNTANYLSDQKREKNSSKIYDEMDIFPTVNVDDEAKDFIYRFFINRLWVNCFETKGSKELQNEIEISKKQINDKNEVRRIIARTFLEEYEGATNLPIPPLKALDKKTGKPIKPWLSQLLTAYKITQEKHFANFSGTGAGKTLSAVIASKAINAKMTVIICPNALIENGQWENEAEACFDGNHTITGYNAFLEKYDKNKSKFLIINWDKLNQKDKSDKLVKTLAKQKIDLVVIDEIHFAKNVKSIRFLNLGRLLTEARRKNPELRTLAMTATPVVNELIEGKTQLQLLTGTKYNELQTTPYTSNAIELWSHFTTINIRHRPEYTNEIFKEYDVHAPIPPESELEFLNKNPLAIEQYLTDYRIPKIVEILKEINEPTIIYTDYVGHADELVNHKSITQKLATVLQKEEIEFGFYTGKNKTGFPDFIDKKIDVLIASNPLAVGVDKLQYRCRHLIFNSLPWTNARYRQIIGRISRPGQKDSITIYHVKGNFPAKAYDLREKLEKIANKARLADCAVDGDNLPEGKLPSHQTVIKNTIDWLKRLQKGELSVITRNPYVIEFAEEEISRDLRKHGVLEDMNKKFGNSNSKTIFDMAQKDVTFLEHYTDQQKKSEKHLTINPTDFLIQKLKEMPQFYKICDMGCGLQNKIRKKFGKRVKSFDIGTYDIDELIPCDITDVSKYIPKPTQDIVIFSQSLMCKNWPDMILEAARCLKKYGRLMIVIQTQQWRNRIEKLLNVINDNGFEIIGEPKIKGEFTFIDAEKTRIIKK